MTRKLDHQAYGLDTIRFFIPRPDYRLAPSHLFKVTSTQCGDGQPVEQSKVAWGSNYHIRFTEDRHRGLSVHASLQKVLYGNSFQSLPPSDIPEACRVIADEIERVGVKLNRPLQDVALLGRMDMAINLRSFPFTVSEVSACMTALNMHEKKCVTHAGTGMFAGNGSRELGFYDKSAEAMAHYEDVVRKKRPMENVLREAIEGKEMAKLSGSLPRYESRLLRSNAIVRYIGKVSLPDLADYDRLKKVMLLRPIERLQADHGQSEDYQGKTQFAVILKHEIRTRGQKGALPRTIAAMHATETWAQLGGTRKAVMNRLLEIYGKTMAYAHCQRLLADIRRSTLAKKDNADILTTLIKTIKAA